MKARHGDIVVRLLVLQLCIFVCVIAVYAYLLASVPFAHVHLHVKLGKNIKGRTMK